MQQDIELKNMSAENKPPKAQTQTPAVIPMAPVVVPVAPAAVPVTPVAVPAAPATPPSTPVTPTLKTEKQTFRAGPPEDIELKEFSPPTKSDTSEFETTEMAALEAKEQTELAQLNEALEQKNFEYLSQADPHHLKEILEQPASSLDIEQGPRLLELYMQGYVEEAKALVDKTGIDLRAQIKAFNWQLNKLALPTILDLAIDHADIYKKLSWDIVQAVFNVKNIQNSFERCWGNAAIVHALLLHPNVKQTDKKRILKFAFEKDYMATVDALQQDASIGATTRDLLQIKKGSNKLIALEWLNDHSEQALFLAIAGNYSDTAKTLCALKPELNLHAALNQAIVDNTPINSETIIKLLGNTYYSQALINMLKPGQIITSRKSPGQSQANAKDDVAPPKAMQPGNKKKEEKIPAKPIKENSHPRLEEKLRLAVENDREDTVVALLRQGAKADDEALFRIAGAHNRFSIVTALLQAYQNPYQQALLLAIKEGHSNIVHAWFYYDSYAASDINDRIKYPIRWKALRQVMQSGNEKIVKAFLDAGAETDFRHEEVLIELIKFSLETEHENITNILLDVLTRHHNNTMNQLLSLVIQSGYKKMALNLVRDFYRSEQLLKQSLSAVFPLAVKNNDLKMIQALLNAKVTPDQQTLELAVQHKNLDIVTRFLEAGAIPDLQTLTLAIDSNDKNLVNTIINALVLPRLAENKLAMGIIRETLLVVQKERPDILKVWCDSPRWALMMAVENNLSELTHHLSKISYWINANTYNSESFIVAAEHGHTNIVNVLVKHVNWAHKKAALSIAFKKNHQGVIDALLNEMTTDLDEMTANIDQQTSVDFNPKLVLLAAQKKHVPIMFALLSNKDERALALAVKMNYAEIAGEIAKSMLLRKPADVRIIEGNLEKAIHRCDAPTVRALLIALVKQYIQEKENCPEEERDLRDVWGFKTAFFKDGLTVNDKINAGKALLKILENKGEPQSLMKPPHKKAFTGNLLKLYEKARCLHEMQVSRDYRHLVFEAKHDSP